MALKATYDDRLKPPYGETPDEPIRCVGNGTTGEWLDRYIWTPGNGSRYGLLYGRRLREPTQHDTGCEYVLILLSSFGNTGPTAIVFSEQYLHHSYVEEKLQINTADAAGVLAFLDRMGHEVGYPRPVAIGE